jgi:outer membrane receptor protein involved in Fe transport
MSGIRSARPVFLTALLASTALTSMAVAADNGGIETVVVTAEKRTEDVQHVPLSIQVLGNQKLQDLHVESFSDYAQFLPSVAFSANAAGGGLNGPGFANVYMRGVSSGNDGNHSGSQPSVGIYLDEQPITTIGGALDIHAYDIARVESLAGPQGTLYGASSEAGTIRIITNKPDTSGFSAAYDVEVNDVDHGGVGAVGEGYVNIPLSNNAAIRIVGWDEHDAGYIDNVAGTDVAGGVVNGVRTFPIGPISVSNAPFRKNDENYTDIYGGRAALQIDLDNNWTITPSFMGQETQAHGSYAFDPAVGDLDVVKFAPEFSNDQWWQAALTVQGKIGNLDVTYAGAYMDRRVHSQLDYSDYSYFYDTYYDSYGKPPAFFGNYFTNNAGQLINPSQIIIGRDHFTKNSHELRIASSDDGPLRFVAGLFYERQNHDIIQQYYIPGFADALSIPGWANTLWLTNQVRSDQDYAAFGEISYKIFPSLTATLGGRVFESDNSLKGFFGYSQNWDDLVGFSNGMPNCFLQYAIVKNTPCTDLDKSTSEKGFTHKVNVNWQVDDDHLLYVTWSTGFRPGGVNRNSLVTDQPYKPDYLTNYEVGWKTSWFDDTLHWNGALYWEDWKNFQFSFLGPNSLTVIANVGQARIVGLESDVLWRASDHFTLTAGGSYNDAQLTQPYCKDPGTCPPYDAPDGQQLPITPRFKGNATGRYTWDMMGMQAHFQTAIVYNGSAWPDLRTFDRGVEGKMAAYTNVDFSFGVQKDQWWGELALLNAFDERDDLYNYSECTAGTCGAERYAVTNRPMTIALRVGQKF